jgi:hypothetical protein
VRASERVRGLEITNFEEQKWYIIWALAGDILYAMWKVEVVSMQEEQAVIILLLVVLELFFFNLGCLHPVAYVRSGDGGFLFLLRNVTIVG